MLDFAAALPVVVNWLLTYAIHSTILICSVYLIATLLGRVGDGFKDLLWKLALMGAIVTATAQVGAGIRPVLGAFEVETGGAEVSAVGGEVDEVTTRRHVIMTDSGTYSVVVENPPSEIRAHATDGPPVWPWVLVGLWGFGAALSLARLGFGARRLRKALKDRKEVLDDPVLEGFLTLRQNASIKRKVRLTSSAAIDTPIAYWRSEVVVPERALRELNAKQMHAVLAHELAHLERRDPLWKLVGAMVEAVFFFQPLNRLARKQMQQIAEYLCDDWTVRHTGSGEHLATSLATVARWRGGLDATPLGPGMLKPGRPFVHRVNRLLDHKRDRSKPEGGPAHLGISLGVLAGMTWLAPGVVSAATTTPIPITRVEKADPVLFVDEVEEEEADEVAIIVEPQKERCRSGCGHDHGHLHGHVHGFGFPFPDSEMHFWGWSGHHDADVDIDFDFGLRIAVPDVEVQIDLDHLGHVHDRMERARERMERAREREQRAMQRARRHQERAAERAQRHLEREVHRHEREMERLEQELETEDEEGLVGKLLQEALGL
jgi:hypothetical protein